MKPLGSAFLFSVAWFLSSMSLRAVDPSAAPLPQPAIEQRVADIEAYINNTARATDDRAVSMIPGGGPGHSAWMMTSAALVLFMTLPGLALFYGGLVRRKNVLSILAQCLGLAALVTILWWACGYSLTYARGNAFIGGWNFSFLQHVGASPNKRLRAVGSAQPVRRVSADVRDHHAGADGGGDRRADEIQGHHALQHSVDVRGLLSRSPTWSGEQAAG